MINLTSMVREGEPRVLESLTLIFNNPFKIRKEFFESSFAEIVFKNFLEMVPLL
jgi:hypothetical protein